MLDLARLDQLQNASVLVIGDVMLDRYFIGDTNRISGAMPIQSSTITPLLATTQHANTHAVSTHTRWPLNVLRSAKHCRRSMRRCAWSSRAASRCA